MVESLALVFTCNALGRLNPVGSEDPQQQQAVNGAVAAA